MQHFKISKILVVLLFVLFAGSLAVSCKHEPLPYPLPNADTIPVLPRCDSSRVYFVNDVMPYINATCAIPGCHSHNDPTAGIDLSSYNAIMSAKVKGKLIVVPGDPLNSKLCRVLFALDLIPMAPLFNFQLPSQGRDNIVKWVQQGAVNDACEYQGDTSSFSFKRDIRPLINKYCTGCHYGNYASDSLELISYPQIKSQVDQHRLYESITGQPGFVRMPYDGVVMQPAEIIKVRKWIEDGAPNN